MRVLTASNKQPIVRKMNPGYTKFDLSHSHKMSGDMGYLYPICTLPVIPGDRVSLGVEGVVRIMPMIASPLHEVWCKIRYFYVPFRIVDNTFTDFISGGADGLDTTSPPRWTPSGIAKTAPGTLWDNLGFPTDVLPSLDPVAWPLRAYNMIWNWHIRNVNLQNEIDITTNEDLLLDNWESDYFTAQLLTQQRGIAPALPISGILDVDSSGEFIKLKTEAGTAEGNMIFNAATVPRLYPSSYGSWGADEKATFGSQTGLQVDLSSGVTFDIADLREAMQIQRFLEINARSGTHFNDFLRGQFDVAPLDKTLQEPEFIGQVSMPVMMDEVIQTSVTGTTPQGNVAGKGLAIGSQFAGSIRVEEPGVIIGIMSIKPKPAYQQGIHRPWLIESKYDYPFPVFANLSEQITKVGEIYVDGTADNADFGYTGRYDEYRIMHDSVHGLMKTVSAGFAHWHMGRIFSSQPALNGSFVQCDCSAIKSRIMAVPSQPTFVANIGNRIEVSRPLPLFANPSIMERI